MKHLSALTSNVLCLDQVLALGDHLLLILGDQDVDASLCMLFWQCTT